MDVTQYVLLGAVIAGITELLNRLRAKDYWVAATIVTAAVTGLLFGIFDVENLTPVTGLAAGFGASGAIKLVGSLGQKSQPAPSTLVTKAKV